MRLETAVLGIFQVILALSTSVAFAEIAENIDPNNDGSQYAYGENIGWINFEPNRPEPNVGATVTKDRLIGFVWAENIGWINLDPNIADPNVGIKNDGTGLLSGFAWGENVGWINFRPNYGGVTIDADGNFDGWAWGENIGWIHLQSTFKIDGDDLANFTVQWLQTGSEQEADLNKDGKVNLVDFSVLAHNWLNDCPLDWQLGPASYRVKTSWAGTP